ncbi:transcriptional regulator Ure2p [Trichomonascus vanleenenianus]|uniref:glutathione peroxidase n=1 Tax=Trichomonascus vanleenenianus TaxID=2268995 RepID=UPI003ECB50D2
MNMEAKKPVSNLSSALAAIHLDNSNSSNMVMSHNNNLQGDLNEYNLSQYNNTTTDRIAEYRRNPPSDGITLFSHRSAPNGFKVAVVLSELGIKFKTFFLDFKKSEQRSPYYVSLNPNARIPSIIDHDNNDVSVWESGAILVYLCQRAGPNCPLFSDDYVEQSQIMSWVFFQASGHAPMVGQALHFRYFHPEMIPSAVERYVGEVRRIYSVVEMRLAEKREQLIMEMEDDEEAFIMGTTPLSESKYFEEPVWLVGNRITIADLSFVTWNHVVDRIGISLKNEFPEVYKWTKFMMERRAVIRALSGLESA